MAHKHEAVQGVDLVGRRDKIANGFGRNPLGLGVLRGSGMAACA